MRAERAGERRLAAMAKPVLRGDVGDDQRRAPDSGCGRSSERGGARPGSSGRRRTTSGPLLSAAKSTVVASWCEAQSFSSAPFCDSAGTSALLIAVRELEHRAERCAERPRGEEMENRDLPERMIKRRDHDRPASTKKSFEAAKPRRPRLARRRQLVHADEAILEDEPVVVEDPLRMQESVKEPEIVVLVLVEASGASGAARATRECRSRGRSRCLRRSCTCGDPCCAWDAR